MTCSCTWTRSVRHSGSGCRQAKAPRGSHIDVPRTIAQPSKAEVAVEVVGTWDFKWPPGSRLRVAFQLPIGTDNTNCAQLTRVFEAIEAQAQRWMGEPAKAPLGNMMTKPSKANIELDFGGDLYRVLPARQSEAEAGGKLTTQSEPLNRSNLDTRNSANWRALRGQLVRSRGAQADSKDVEVDFDYEILINLDPLVLSGDPTAPDESPGRKLYMPTSELGSYARRLDYGVPSMYLGPVGAFCRDLPASPVERLIAYYTEEHAHSHYVARAVVHEFGHALGMPHENQNPLCDKCPQKLNERELDALRVLYEEVLGINAADVPDFEEVMRNQFIAWPDNRDFSDWEEHAHSSDEPAESVMTTVHSAYLALSPSSFGDPRFTSFLKKTGPSAADRARLRYMYGAVSR